MSDRELLEMAAKAASLPLCSEWDTAHHGIMVGRGDGNLYVWNPLEDDGDALRLAVKRHINIRYVWDGCDDQFEAVFAERGKISCEEQIGLFGNEYIDEAAATRRAIVRAAAAIGKEMP